jgi:hypothetical protein
MKTWNPTPLDIERAMTPQVCTLGEITVVPLRETWAKRYMAALEVLSDHYEEGGLFHEFDRIIKHLMYLKEGTATPSYSEDMASCRPPIIQEKIDVLIKRYRGEL